LASTGTSASGQLASPNHSRPQAAHPQSPEAADAQTQPALRGAEARRFLGEIQRNKVADVYVRFFAPTDAFASPNGELSRQFINFFDLTPAETSRISGLMQTTKTGMWNAAKAQAQVSQTETGGILVKIPPVEAGPDIYDKMMDGFQSVLGSERFSEMMLFNDGYGQLERVFDQFGGQISAISIEPGNDGRYKVKTSKRRPKMTELQEYEMTLDQIKDSHPEWVGFILPE